MSYRREVKIRLPVKEHVEFTREAHEEGVSLNQWILEAGRERIHRKAFEEACRIEEAQP